MAEPVERPDVVEPICLKPEDEREVAQELEIRYTSLADEKPPGKTVPYDELVADWGALPRPGEPIGRRSH